MHVNAFEVIGDPTRRAILDLLRNGPMTAGAIAAVFPTSRPAISRHLRHLRAAGAVVVEERGRTRIYRLSPDWHRPIATWLRRFDPPISESALDAFETEVYRTKRDVRAGNRDIHESLEESA